MTGGPAWTRNYGDTGPALARTLRADPTIGQRVGTPLNLTGADVTATVRRHSDRLVVHTATATIVGNPVDGNVELPLSPLISQRSGLHSVEWRVIDSGGAQRTYPSALDPDWLLIASQLPGDEATTPPTPQGFGGVWVWSGSTYELDPDARIYERSVGAPDPTGRNENDLVITENP